MEYNWTLKDTIFKEDKGTVVSAFSCGGGSSLGYKKAGFKVIGAIDIDKRLTDVYKLNLDTKYVFTESITDFVKRDDIPSEFYNIDILDGSPPCSSFSLAGAREKHWGKKKKFMEGQQEQVLDTLFFDFIDLAKKLQPKVVVAENVKGLLLGKAKKYLTKIYEEFDKAGYYCQHYLLDASTMNIPQKRERVFIVCLRKDLAWKFLIEKDLFSIIPKLELNFNYPVIPFKDVCTYEKGYSAPKGTITLLEKCKDGESCSLYNEKGNYFGTIKLDFNKVIGTLTAGMNRSKSGYFYKNNGVWQGISVKDALLCQSFPLDYNFGEFKDPYYIIGMSVPPLMIAKIATEIFNQWLSKI